MSPNARRNAARLAVLAAASLATSIAAASMQRIESASLVETARVALAAHLAPRSVRFEAKAAAPLPLLEVAGGPAELVARPIAGAQLPRSRMQVWVDVRVDGRLVRALPVAFDVKAWRAAWVATQDVRSATPLDHAALTREVIDVAAASAEPLATLPPGARLRRPLLAGEPLLASHVESAPAVQRGTAVVVISRIGAFGVEARAESLQDGHAGAQVWVRLAASTGPVRARVVGPATVEVEHE